MDDTPSESPDETMLVSASEIGDALIDAWQMGFGSGRHTKSSAYKRTGRDHHTWVDEKLLRDVNAVSGRFEIEITAVEANEDVT